MEFDRNQPIYRQISGYLSDQLLQGNLQDGDKVPSVRELAVALEVNPNTVARTFLDLQQEGILENRRGIGYFVAAGASDRVLERRRDQFVQEESRRFFRTMRLVRLDFSTIAAMYETWSKEHENQ